MSSSRRTFLKNLTLGTLAMGTTPLVVNAASPHVLILGAGMAGLVAARRLAQKGLKVTVIEGRQRIGGRIYTNHDWANIPLDLGASWIHGETNNPITKLADTVQAKRISTSYDSSKLYIDPVLAKQGIDDTNEDKMERIVEKAFSKAANLDEDISLQQAVDAQLKAPASASLKAQMAFYLNSTYEQEYSGAAHELSAQTCDDNEEFEGADVLFPQGYEQLTNYLAQGLTIHLGQVITKIEYTNKGVKVSTQDKTYTADYAINTLPLGVLKQQTIQFNPPLPTDKQQAIERLGMGLLNKTFFQFDRVFWPKNTDWFEYFSPQAGRWAEWVNFAKAGAPVLLGFNAADRARELEAWSDQAIIADGMQVLKTMFGKNIPNPVATKITRWAQDPFAYGSYSFNAVGSTNQDRAALARPLQARLFWAGEATHSEYPGTVHGAYLSGARAAKALLQTL